MRTETNFYDKEALRIHKNDALVEKLMGYSPQGESMIREIIYEILKEDHDAFAFVNVHRDLIGVRNVEVSVKKRGEVDVSLLVCDIIDALKYRGYSVSESLYEKMEEENSMYFYMSEEPIAKIV